MAEIITLDSESHAVPLTRDLGYDHQTKRFVRVGGSMTLTTGQLSIKQAVTIKLLFFLGEWFLDTSKGVPYFQTILVKSPNLVAIKSELAEQIRTVRSVRSVTSITADYDRGVRTLAVNWTADSDFGPIQGAVPFTL